MDHQDSDQILQKEADILGNILPADVWELVCKKIPKSGLRDMSNASPYFRSLLLPKRTHFLLPDVLKPLSEELEKEELKGPFIYVKRQQNEEESEEADGQGNRAQADEQLGNELEMVKNIPNILKIRQVCKSWNKSVDQFIEDTSQPSFFNVDLPSRNKLALAKAKYNYFGLQSWKLPQLFPFFEQTHLPLVHPPRNPLIGRLVVLQLPNIPFNRILRDWMDHGKQLLEYYGQHIRILNLGIPYTLDEHLSNHLWLSQCLLYVPNLTHLKVGTFGGKCDMQFGEHIYNPYLSTTAVPLDNFLMQRFRVQLQNVYHRHQRRRRLGEDGDQALNPANIEQAPLVDIEANPLLSLKCLKLCNLPDVTFNELIHAYPHVEWLHIERGSIQPHNLQGRDYMDWRRLEFPNLKTFYIQLHSPVEARQLWYLNSRLWGTLTRLHLEYSWEAEFFEWGKIFETIQENWGRTLVELKLRLPKPTNLMEKSQARRDAVNYKLNLPKLKRLKIWICKECDVPLTFLENVMQLPGLEFKRYYDCRDH